MNAIVILGSFINAYKISPASGKNLYMPYCSAYNGGGPPSIYYYNPFPHYPYNYAPSAVYGNVVPVRRKPKNKPRNKDKIWINRNEKWKIKNEKKSLGTKKTA